MVVYVDNYRARKRVGRLDAVWSHLLADSESELLAFAERIGLRRDWIQYPGTVKVHFDVTDSVRARAIRAGARAIGWRESGEIIARRRDAERARRAFEAPPAEPVVEQLALDETPPADPAAAFARMADQIAAGVIPEGAIACGPPPPRRRRSPAAGERARKYSSKSRNHWWADGDAPHWHHCRWCGISYENRPVERSGAWHRAWFWPEQRPAGAVDGDTLTTPQFPRCPGPPEGWTTPG